MAEHTLLIVEDDADFSETLARAMRKRNFEVVLAGDHDQARLRAIEHRPTHAVVDLKLPGDSGLKVVETLAGLPRPPRRRGRDRRRWPASDSPPPSERRWAPGRT